MSSKLEAEFWTRNTRGAGASPFYHALRAWMRGFAACDIFTASAWHFAILDFIET